MSQTPKKLSTSTQTDIQGHRDRQKHREAHRQRETHTLKQTDKTTLKYTEQKQAGTRREGKKLMFDECEHRRHRKGKEGNNETKHNKYIPPSLYTSQKGSTSKQKHDHEKITITFSDQRRWPLRSVNIRVNWWDEFFFGQFDGPDYGSGFGRKLLKPTQETQEQLVAEGSFTTTRLMRITRMLNSDC